MSHQGMNDRPLQNVLSHLYQWLSPDLNYLAGHLNSVLDRKVEHLQPPKKLLNNPAAHGKIRVGFLSSKFFDHSIGRIMFETIFYLSRLPQIQVFVIFVESLQFNTEFDYISQKYSEMLGSSFIRTFQDINDIRETVELLLLDILVFTDVGMDTITYITSFSRLAKFQVWSYALI